MRRLAIVVSMIGLALLVPASALAQPTTFGALVGDACDENNLTGADSSLCADASKNESAEKFFRNIVNFLLMVVGILAVIMIIVAAIKYTTSGGDSAKLTSAKNTLLYSIIGLAVAVLSFAIVNFVLDEVSPPAGGNNRLDPRIDNVAE